MDSNNFTKSVGVGEREARVASPACVQEALWACPWHWQIWRCGSRAAKGVSCNAACTSTCLEPVHSCTLLNSLVQALVMGKARHRQGPGNPSRPL